MKTCFSVGKLMKQFGIPPFLREFPLSTNPLLGGGRSLINTHIRKNFIMSLVNTHIRKIDLTE